MGRVSTRLDDAVEQQIAARAAEEHLDKSGWIARACALVLEGGVGDAALRNQLGYLTEKLADSEMQLADYRAVVEEVRLLRSRQEDIARAQGAAFERVFDGISLLRGAAPALLPAPEQQQAVLEAPAPAAERPILRFLRGLIS